ncbi:MAG: ribbon-helix-helix protein, CopG family [Peptostreptococcaceae bacterium]|nr:ribbon-helix-helix protein, CopG family [Peptostreptococcaceae bacterium]
MEQLSISLSKDLLDKAREQANKQSRSIASVIREALIKYLDNKR